MRLVEVFTQKVDPASLRIVLARPSGLPDAPHAEEEEARRRSLKPSLVVLNHVGDYASILPTRQGILSIYCDISNWADRGRVFHLTSCPGISSSAVSSVEIKRTRDYKGIEVHRIYLIVPYSVKSQFRREAMGLVAG